MRFFDYKDGNLCAEEVSLRQIAEEVGTPTYVYSTATLKRHYEVLKGALHGLEINIAFAVKSNSNAAVIAALAGFGAGADTVSEGEIRRAINAGISPSKIVFSGVGKTYPELEYAVATGIYQINIESLQELSMLSKTALKLGKTQKAVVRVNPDVAAGGHDKISTGKKTSKFGVSINDAYTLFEMAKDYKGVELVGLAVHIGSQILDLTPLKSAYEVLANMTHELRSRGFKIERLDLGGGLGAVYEDQGIGPDLVEYGNIVRQIIGPLNTEISIEPGRIIAANAGVLLTRAIVTKENGGREFAVLDAAMNDLLRPAFYDAYHQILPLNEPQEKSNLMPITLVGPICETGDTFTTDRPLPSIGADDLMVFMSAGAYGFTMASTYNSRPLAAEVMVNGDKWEVVRPRQTYEEMFGMEKIPVW